MSFNCAYLAKPTLDKLKALVRTVGKFEIGGPMVGYISRENLVITNLDGPGSNGRCSAFSVTIDGEHSKRFCDSEFYHSSGLVDYVGDWHCHPAICIRPSSGDERAMEILAKSPGLTPNPVSLIYGSILGRFKIYRWDKSENRLIRISHKVVSQDQIDRLMVGGEL